MTGYVLSVAADLDLDEIWEYIAADNIRAADRWIERLFAVVAAARRYFFATACSAPLVGT